MDIVAFESWLSGGGRWPAINAIVLAGQDPPKQCHVEERGVLSVDVYV